MPVGGAPRSVPCDPQGRRTSIRHPSALDRPPIRISSPARLVFRIARKEDCLDVRNNRQRPAPRRHQGPLLSSQRAPSMFRVSRGMMDYTDRLKNEKYGATQISRSRKERRKRSGIRTDLIMHAGDRLSPFTSPRSETAAFGCLAASKAVLRSVAPQPPEDDHVARGG